MKTLLAAGTVLLGMALPAHAAEWMYCLDGEEKVLVGILSETSNVIAIDTIEIEVDDKKWSTAPGEGVTTITKGQAFESEDQIWIDVTDDKADEVAAQIRLFFAYEGEDYVHGGIVRMPGVGTWAVSCTSP